MKSKIFAAYLPQYHEIYENNEFWGEGFTDWVGVKQAKPLFFEHKQPKVPLNNNYYDLSKEETIRWQVKLANKYGIDGFNIYHYWFKKGHKVLEKPAEILLNNKDININYFFSWDNTSWVRSWSNIQGNSWAPKYDIQQKNSKKQILLELDYGKEEDWIKHFNYLLPFFRDERYLKINNKPVFIIMKNDRNPIVKKMVECWNKMSKDNKFDGIYVMNCKRKIKNSIDFDNQFIYEPRYSVFGTINTIYNMFPRIKKYLPRITYDYKKSWLSIIRTAKLLKNKNTVYCGFVRYDDSPRRGVEGNIIVNETPSLFEKYFSILYDMSCKEKKSIILLTAWNEWGEGAYLEPDNVDKYAYLEKIKKIKGSYNV